jgi:hypothetical protein
MQIGGRGVEMVAPEQATRRRAEELHVERFSRPRQLGQPHDDRGLTLDLPPARDHRLGHATHKRVGVRALLDDIEQSSGVGGVVR